MRLSDILKRSSAVQTGEKPSADVPRQPVKAVVTPSRDTVQEPRPEIKAPTSQVRQPDHVSAEEAYAKAVSEIKTLFTSIGRNPSSGLSAHDDIISLLKSGSEEILTLADRATPDTYIYAHSVNVMIFSVLIGLNSGFSERKIRVLALCACLHDIGMLKYMNLAARPETLSQSDMEQIKKHSQTGAEMVQELAFLAPDDRRVISETILQVHERKNGSGYPGNLKNEETGELARIIAIADTYEAMTHPRPFRDRTIPHEALKSMICSADELFDKEFMKHFIDQLSLYPPGSYVKLNTNEIARVVRTSKGMCTRPQVRIIIDASMNRAKEQKLLNLTEEQMLFIKEAVNEIKLDLADRKLAIELKAVRWWVKGI